MNIKIAKLIALTSIILLGLLVILAVWGIISWGEITAKIMATLGIIFVVSAFIFEVYRKDSKK